jgi:hypothetical protein
MSASLEEWRQVPNRPAWFIHPDDRERAARAACRAKLIASAELTPSAIP